jgi:cytochrome c551/c552
VSRQKTFEETVDDAAARRRATQEKTEGPMRKAIAQAHKDRADQQQRLGLGIILPPVPVPNAPKAPE